MLWSSLFGFTNLLALAGWAVLLLGTRRPLANSFVMYAAVGLLCLTYSILLIALIARLVDPAALPGAEPFDPARYDIENLRRLFLSDGGLVTAWTHYLALDLFAGLWIARDADQKKVSRLVQAPILILTFLAGPLGLFSWLVLRERRARRAGR
jgi:uncharacterized protein YhhL (DUF1145 family)